MSVPEAGSPSLLCPGVENVDPARLSVPLEPGPGLSMVGAWGQPHSCFLTREKEPQLLLSCMLSPRRMAPIL